MPATPLTAAVLPAFVPPDGPPSVLAMLRHGLSDPAAIIPAAIYHQFSVKLPGRWSPLVVAEPETVRRILLDQGEAFGRNPFVRRMLRRSWGRGLAAAEGSDWATQRRAAAPAFRPEAVEAATAVMTRVAAKTADAWPIDRAVELQSAIGPAVLEIVLHTLLTGSDATDPERLAADMAGLAGKFGQFGLLDLLPLPEEWIDRFRGIGRSPAERRTRAFAGALAQRRASPPDPIRDLPALLRDVAPLDDTVFGFLLAGLETTALAMAWALYLLALHPALQEAVRDEARAADAVPRTGALPVARRVVQEALRLYPTAPLLVRTARVPMTILDEPVLAGQAVIIPIYAIHRHRLLWDEPDVFDPDRFDRTGALPRQYLPFGSGPRQCIAGGFAMAEATALVSGMVGRLELRVADSVPPAVSLRVTTHAPGGLHVTARRW